jgi:hypothetical protein
VLVAGPLALAGCHELPRPVGVLPDPALRTIAAGYRATVRDLHDRPGETWHHDWTGNILPNTLGALGSGDRGLCYEWQAEVWKGIQPALAATGWRGVGIAANVGHWTEHHVVVVYDPRRTAREGLLRPPTPIAWVLDPWHTGEADVYTLRDWLRTGTAEWYSVELEDLR